MTTKWSFDQQFIKDVIDKGYVLLEDPKLTKSKKKNIRIDINKFQSFLRGDYEITPSDQRLPHNVEQLKRVMLKKMQEQYKTLGEDLILWTMDLCYNEIFTSPRKSRKTRLSIDDQADLTLENYATNAPGYRQTAEQILSPAIIRQVQEVPDLEDTSYCYYDEITELPFLIVNPKQAPWALNHETQHAVEELKKLEANRYFHELGPILLELLFNDTLYKNQGFLNKGDYSDRIEDSEETIRRLYRYFDIMLTFAQTNFQVPADVFLDEFSNICYASSEEGIVDFIREEVEPSEIVDEMAYLYSYLRAIELREQIHDKKQDCIQLLEPHLTSKRFVFKPTEESFATYRRFTQEMKSKTKKL